MTKLSIGIIGLFVSFTVFTFCTGGMINKNSDTTEAYDFVDGMQRKMTPLKWLQRQVRKINKKLGNST